MKQFVFIALASLAFAAGGGYHLSLYQPSSVSGTELKRGDVTLELKDNMARLKQGKTMVEAPVKVENSNYKYPNTQVGYKGNSHEISDITVGGTTLHVLFE